MGTTLVTAGAHKRAFEPTLLRKPLFVSLPLTPVGGDVSPGAYQISLPRHSLFLISLIMSLSSSSSSKKDETQQRGPLVKFGPFEQAIGVLLVMGLGAKVPAKRQLTRSRESDLAVLLLLAACLVGRASRRWRCGRWTWEHPILLSSHDHACFGCLSWISYTHASRGRSCPSASAFESGGQEGVIIILLILLVLLLLFQADELERRTRQRDLKLFVQGRRSGPQACVWGIRT
jgi:cell division protein FtsW (lipid II flippase)